MTVLNWEDGAPQRRGWSKAARLDALVHSAKTGEPLAPEAPPRLDLAAALYCVRRERRLTQASVAGALGVNLATYNVWEGGKGGPQPRQWPGIMRFLGYDPLCSDPNTFAEKIGVVRRRHGLSYRALGRLIGGSENVVIRLERGQTAPSPNVCVRIERLLFAPPNT